MKPPSKFWQHVIAALLAIMLTTLAMEARCDVILDEPCGVDVYAVQRGKEAGATPHTGEVIHASLTSAGKSARGRASQAWTPQRDEATERKHSHGSSNITTPLAIYSMSFAADFGTTAWAESKGAVEANPLLQNKGQRYVIGAAAVAGLTLADVELQKRGHKGWARALRVVTVLTRGYAVVRAVRAVK